MAETRRTVLDGQPVVQVQVRDRPRWTRTRTAPHPAEVIVTRPQSPYHQIVFTPSEWAAFIADVKAELFDLEDEL